LASLGNLRYRSKEEVEFYTNVVENKARPLEEFRRTRHITEWRVIDEYPEFEISADGTIRNRETKVLRGTGAGRGVPDRFRVTNPEKYGSRYKMVNVRMVRNKAFPELEPW